MQKIISVFQRNYDTDRLIRNEVVPGAEWVLAGEGVATRKFDGTPVLVKDGLVYKRYDVKQGKPVPEGAIACQEPDEVTGHWPHWVRVTAAKPEDRWIYAAYLQSSIDADVQEGTYEAVGPHFQGNPEKFPEDLLVIHGAEQWFDFPRDFYGMREYLKPLDVEGVVFHHPDGRMAKVKKKDFGLKRVPV